MMHHSNFIVSLYGNNNKPFREYDHQKLTRTGTTAIESSANVFIDFDTEFKIGFKSIDFRRRRLEIYVDGSLITNDLIIMGSSYLERYMNSDKKFKTINPNSSQCADPTNSENGVIRISAYKEYVPQKPLHGILRSAGMNSPGVPLHEYDNHSATLSLGGSVNTNCAYTTSSFSQPANPVGEKVAIGEGSVSDQKFTSTIWNGDDGEPDIFVFNIRAPVKNSSPVGFCYKCGTKAVKQAAFCHKCGADLSAVVV